MHNFKRTISVILICTLVLSVVIPIFVEVSADDVENSSPKVSDELLEIMEISYDDLLADNYTDNGMSYSCIIWIEDIDMESAVIAEIDAAEMTRDTYTIAIGKVLKLSPPFPPLHTGHATFVAPSVPSN